MSVVKNIGKVKAVKFVFHWDISNLKIGHCDVGDHIESPLFSTVTDTELKWRLWLYPKGDDVKVKDYIGLFLVSYNESDVGAQFSIHVFNKSKQIRAIYFPHRTFVFSPKDHHRGLGKNDFLNSDLVFNEDEGLIGGNITVFCQISIDPAKAKILEPYNTQLSDQVRRKLKELDRLESLLDNEKLSDVTFNVDGVALQAHKNILMCKSPVFAAMFEHEMKENTNNVVHIEGIEHAIFKEMLRFVYAGKVNEIENIADDLLAVADKYSLEELKGMCEETIADNLSSENVVECLKLADVCNAPNLKRQVLDFIVLNVNDLLDLPEFKTIGDWPSNAAYEVFRALGSALQNKPDDVTSKFF